MKLNESFNALCVTITNLGPFRSGHVADTGLYWLRMKLAVFILNNEELLEQVLESYVEAGVQGATILDSEGMGRFLTYEVPLFAEFRQFMKGNKPYNKTIISVIREESVIPRLEHLLDRAVGGFGTPGTGIFFTVPVDHAVGLVDENMMEGNS
jgi:nitrogen regulatory protein P-II 1